MKIEYFEHQWGLELVMTPETPEEVGQLLRFCNNAKA